jgi:hypothetical protein
MEHVGYNREPKPHLPDEHMLQLQHLATLREEKNHITSVIDDLCTNIKYIFGRIVQCVVYHKKGLVRNNTSRALDYWITKTIRIWELASFY